MRVIAGTARSRKLNTREGNEVRPTPDRVKEAMFNIIQFEVEGRRILDLFAGSGQLGIEALSRGAREAVFVDASRESAEMVRQNVEYCGFSDSAHIRNSDFKDFLAGACGTFDLAFLDPPYRTGLLEQALPLTAAKMNPGGTILCEHPSDEGLPDCAGGFCRGRSYRYGKILVTLYRRKGAEHP